MPEFLGALRAECGNLVGMVSDLVYDDRYERDNEESGIEVSDEVGFAVSVIRENRLFQRKHQSVSVSLGPK